MTTIREQGELEVGIVVGDSVHTRFCLRPATLADTYAAVAAVPVPDNLYDGTGDKPGANPQVNVAYQMAVDDALILCQIDQLGDLARVPDIPALVAALDPDDMAILRKHAGVLKKKLRQSRPGLPLIVDPNTSSSEPATA